MFTKEQIQNAQSNVKSGADYPQLVQDLKDIGVRSYEHRLADGSTIYVGDINNTIEFQYGQPLLNVNDISSAEKLRLALKIHQASKTDYTAFCMQAAEAGVEKWVSDLVAMTVTYLDKQGAALLTEKIPSI